MYKDLYNIYIYIDSCDRRSSLDDMEWKGMQKLLENGRKKEFSNFGLTQNKKKTFSE